MWKMYLGGVWEALKADQLTDRHDLVAALSGGLQNGLGHRQGFGGLWPAVMDKEDRPRPNGFGIRLFQIRDRVGRRAGPVGAISPIHQDKSRFLGRFFDPWFVDAVRHAQNFKRDSGGLL